jgi:RNA polymerase sigma-70 factor (ECF subfamily)
MIASKRRATSSEPSFPAIFEEYAPFVMRVMRHLGVPAKDLPDQCQEVFVAVFRGLPDFAGRSALRTWIYGICRHVASNHRRRAHVRRERTVSEPPEQTSPAVQDEAVEERRGHPALRLLLDTLDPDKREVFVLFELEELSMKEVAEVCGCPLQTAYSRLHAARRLLLERYRESERMP